MGASGAHRGAARGDGGESEEGVEVLLARPGHADKLLSDGEVGDELPAEDVAVKFDD
jgi:hypothetical protein